MSRRLDQARRSRAPRFGRADGHVTVGIDSHDLTRQGSGTAESVAKRATPGRRADDRVRVRARLDAVPLAHSLVEKRRERTPTELFPLLDRARHRFSGAEVV